MFSFPAHADEEPRLRGGLGLIGGEGLGGGLRGSILFGFELHAGAQLDRHFAIYAEVEAFEWSGQIDGTITSTSGGVGARALAFFGYSPIDAIELAAGPAIDAAGSSSSTEAIELQGTEVAPVLYGGSAYFGFQERLAYRFVIARHGESSHSAVSLCANLHTMIGSANSPSTITNTLTFGAGYEFF